MGHSSHLPGSSYEKPISDPRSQDFACFLPFLQPYGLEVEVSRHRATEMKQSL